ncbi:MAG: archease [Spirochaetota bacterium]
MGYELLDEGTFADVAVKCRAKTPEDLFKYNSEAFAAIMLEDTGVIQGNEKKIIQMQAEEHDLLLYDFINELIYQKDVNNLIFMPANIEIERNNNMVQIVATMKGDRIGKKCSFNVDVKAATMHELSVVQNNDEWISFMILDV